MRYNGLLVLATVFFACGPVQASILPEVADQKWEVSLDGLGDLVRNGTDSVYELHSLVRVDSDFKAQGTFTAPSTFVTGADPGATGIATDQPVTGVVAQMISDMVVIAIYDGGSGSYKSTFADIDALITGGSLGIDDVVFFGSKTGTTATAHLYHETGFSTLDASGTFSGETTYTDSSSNTIGSGVGSTELLTMTFQSIGGILISREFGSAVAAPTGTLIANSISSSGTVRPLVFLDVIGGTEAGLVKDSGMKATVFASGPTPVGYTADVIAAIGAQAPAMVGSTRITLSDPLEFVSVPEPASVAVWGMLALVVGSTSIARRRRAE